MANPDHVAIVRRGAAATDEYLNANPGQTLDLSSAELEGIDLQGCNLAEANFTGANLAGANLRSANLQKAVLAAANLQDCVLQNADCRGAGLHRAELQGADLREVRMDALGFGSQLMCASSATFENVRWERKQIEEVLAIINLNRDWEIRYELVPRAG